MTEGTPTDVPLQRRGEPGSPGPVVPHGVPRFAFLAGEAPPPLAPGSSGRLELARWLTQPGHPLTARVMVNRIWQHHFGRGIVATPSNFGVRGEPPTHPELLDWLAARFVAEGWSIKAIHREIVLSAAYQLSERPRRTQCRARPRRPMALAIPPPPARRRVDPRRHARRLRPARPRPARPPPVPADRGLALDPARRVQDGLPVGPPQRLPHDAAPGEAPVPRRSSTARTRTPRPTSAAGRRCPSRRSTS